MNLSLYHDLAVQEEDEPEDDLGGVGQAVEELEEIGDPELEAMHDRIVEKRWGWKLSSAVIALFVIAGSAVFGWVMRSQISRLPRLDERDAQSLADELRTASELPPHRRRAAIGRALAQVEHDRIPAPLLRAMVDGGRQAEHTRLSALRRALVHPEVRPLWHELCPPTIDLEAISTEPKSGTRIFEACGLHRLDLLSASHVVTSNGDEVLAAHAIMNHLREHDALTDVEVRALQAFARGTVSATPAFNLQ